MIKYLLIIILIIPVDMLAQVEPVNEDWLTKDKSNFINLMEVLLSESKEIGHYKNNIENLDIRDDQSIGFGARRYECAQYGGYITNWISICTYKNEIFYSKISISQDDVEKIELLGHRDTIISKLIAENWSKNISKQNSGLHETLDYEYINDSIYSKFKEYVAKELGVIQKIPPNLLVSNHYEILISPFKKYDFGYSCYYAGRPPIGRTAIQVIKSENPEFIRNIIRGYSPEGRIYGIEALLELHIANKVKLKQEDIDLIKKVIAIEIPINRCQGCIVSSILANDLFDETDYRTILTKNNIILKD